MIIDYIIHFIPSSEHFHFKTMENFAKDIVWYTDTMGYEVKHVMIDRKGEIMTVKIG